MSGVCEQEVLDHGTAVRAGTRSVAPACVALYLAVVVALLFAILDRNHGVFTYTLDDPYIHLALAENLAHGHYGINPDEASSPSSSILWPFLLAPFARAAWGQYVPLILNTLFCGLSAWLIGRIVDGWAWRRPAPAGGLAWWGRFVFAITLMLVANLAGLTFVGMEHGLQVLLALACAAGLIEAFAGRPFPRWCLCAAALGPMVRYENFAMLAAIAVVLYAQGRVGTAVRLAAISVAGPALFSLFLVSRGLPALPTSVLVKAKAYSQPGNAVMTILRNEYWDIHNKIVMPEWWAQLAVGLLLIGLAVAERQRVRRFVLGAAALVAGLQMAIGQFNWFHRYEVYTIAFTALVAATALLESTRLWRSVVVAGLIVLDIPYAQALWETPAAASDVYRQQYQMHRFVTEFYGKSVAVNDLGWVSYRRPVGVYVLDLWGLASPEASRRAHKDAGWLDSITAAHGTGLAMIYSGWYDEGAPDDWDPLATLCLVGQKTSIARPCVVFYSTGVGDKASLTKEMAVFAGTVPAGDRMILGRDATDDR